MFMPGPCEGCSGPCQDNDGECPEVSQPITKLSTPEKITLIQILTDGNNPGNPED